MNSFSPSYFIHVANVLLLVAYSVRDILWLRLFAVGASLISIPYFLLQPTKLWAPLSWSVVFAAINLFQPRCGGGRCCESGARPRDALGGWSVRAVSHRQP
jgi:hypothetical protein